MVDRDPAPEGYRASCLNCGRPLIGHDTASHLPGYAREDEDEFEARFCSEECAENYITSDEEEWEDIEQINRAGAT